MSLFFTATAGWWDFYPVRSKLKHHAAERPVVSQSSESIKTNQPAGSELFLSFIDFRGNQARLKLMQGSERKFRVSRCYQLADNSSLEEFTVNSRRMFIEICWGQSFRAGYNQARSL